MEAQENERGKSEELRFAYDQVRKEIVASDDLALKIVGGTVTLTAAIMTITASQAVPSEFVKGCLFFVASAVSLIGLYQILNQDRATYVLGHYLRMFLEPQMPYMKWETRLYTLRKKAPDRIGYGRFILHHMLSCIFLSIAASFLGTFFLLKSIHPFSIAEIVNKTMLVWFLIGGWSGILVALIVCALCLYKKQRAEIECEWNKLKDKISENENKKKRIEADRVYDQFVK